MPKEDFLNEKRLLNGPWQAFERDIARLLIANNYSDVRIVGGSGDHGADVMGILRNELWLFQCKHTTNSPPPKDAIRQVVEAGRFYKADRLVVATSRPPGNAFLNERARFKRQGLDISICDPQNLLNLMHRTPEYSSFRKSLRTYQDDASTRLREVLLDTGRGQIIFATGLGKTIVMAEVVADLFRDNLIKHNRVLILAHTRDIVEQLHKSFWYQLPKWVSTHQLADGEVPSYWDGMTFATIQSINSKLDILPSFGLVLIDEAHHVGSQMFQRAIKNLKPPMIGGVTATPWRGDGFDIDQILGQAVVKLDISKGLQKGYLSEIDYRLLGDNLDWEFIQSSSKHQYSISQLNRKLIIPVRDEEVASSIKSCFKNEDRHAGIVFSPTIVHANFMAAMLRRFDLRAEAITGDLSPRDRDALMVAFRKGNIDVVTSVDLFNEGVDVPDVDLICFMRATHSRRIFVQQLGRGLRIKEGKGKVIVLDFVTDLRRIAEVLELARSVRDTPIERLGLGNRIIQFNDESAGTFLNEWVLDQASLFLREDDPKLELPRFNFPEPPPPGGIN